MTSGTELWCLLFGMQAVKARKSSAATRRAIVMRRIVYSFCLSTLAPLQLRPQHIEVALVRRADQRHRVRRFADADRVVLGDGEAFLAVEREENLLVRRHDSDFDVQCIG